jgi:hypothetical protein
MAGALHCRATLHRPSAIHGFPSKIESAYLGFAKSLTIFISIRGVPRDMQVITSGLRLSHVS